MMEDTMIDKQVEELKNNPIFSMSLSSKELFHSNFWAWLFAHNEHGREYLEIFFKHFPDSDFKVEREQGKRDITIWCEEKAYIIENKVKSLPDIEQLEKYQEKVGKNIFKKGVISGIIDFHFSKYEENWLKVNNWAFKSYKEICTEIRDKALTDGVENCSFEKDLIVRYADTFLELSNNIRIFFKDNGNIWVTGIIKEIDKYDKIRMGDVIKKIVSNNFCSYLKKITKDVKIPEGFKLKITSDYSHKHAIADICFEQNYGDEEKKEKEVIMNKPFSIGVQIEDGQYRRYIKRVPKVSQRDEIFQYGKRNGWFKDCDGKEITKNRKTGEDYCKYEKNTYTFLYQYRKIDESSKVDSSFEKLSKPVIDDLRMAADIITKD